MKCKMLKKLLIVAICCISTVLAGTPHDYISAGKAYLFEGTPEGVQLAYDNFEAAMQDPSYGNDRELLFLHSVARAALVFVGDNGGQVDTFHELAAQFGLNLDDETGEITYPTNARDSYEVPEDAPDEQAIREALDIIAVELGQIVDTLELIESGEGDRFFVYFTPEQTSMTETLRVGYGEVLLLKGALSALKTQINSTEAYDFTVENLDEIIENYYAGMFVAQRDLLGANPDFLKLLPTANNPAIGKDALAQAALDTIDAIDYILEAIDYMKQENDCCPPNMGEERFLYLEEEDYDATDRLVENLTKLKNALLNDNIESFIAESSKSYELSSVGMQPMSTGGGEDIIGELNLIYDFFGEADGGTFLIYQEFETAVWDIDDVYENLQSPEYLDFFIERYNYGMWEFGILTISFNEDKSEILDGFMSANGMLMYESIQGQLIAGDADTVAFDPNPIYGSNRYPEPLSPRDLLPIFDNHNAPLPGTVGAGLGNDATLGGVLPDMTQTDWQLLGDLQPAGVFSIAQINPIQWGMFGDGGQYAVYSENVGVGFWFDEQIVFEDISGDLLCEQTGNLDIAALYMGYYMYELVGEIVFYDMVEWYDSWSMQSLQRAYEVYLSYIPDKLNSKGSLKLTITIQQGMPYAELFRWVEDYWESGWQPTGIWVNLIQTERGLQFVLDAFQMPMLPGRYLTVNSYNIVDGWYWQDADINQTHLQIAPLGTASGTVYFNKLGEQAVFVEAFIDEQDPAGSVISTARVNEDGSFILEGIGLGSKSYIRAFTPLFGFDNPFELGCLELQDQVSNSQWKPSIEGISLSINEPIILGLGEQASGQMFCNDYSQHLYAFDAIGGNTYNISVQSMMGMYDVELIVYSRNGADELITAYDLYEPIEFICPKSGRYYIELIDNSYECWETKNYTLVIDSPQIHFAADIASADGIGVKDGVVDEHDLNALFAYWLDNYEPVDINGDGIIDFEDFSILASQWLSKQPIPLQWVSVEEMDFYGDVSKYETTNAQYADYLNEAYQLGEVAISGNYVINSFNSEQYYDLEGEGLSFNGAIDGGKARIKIGRAHV